MFTVTTYIYLAIVLVMVVFVAINLYESKKLTEKFCAALVLIPLVLRLLLIK